MFNVRPKPAFPWIHVEPPPAEEVPGFRMNPDGSLRDRQRVAASDSFGYGMPSGPLMPGYANTTRASAPRGFGFLTPSPDFLTPSALSSTQFRPAPQYSASGANLGLPDDALLGVAQSGIGVPRQPSPWLGEMPASLRPLLSTAFDPLTGRHIAPDEPPIDPYTETSQYARETEDVRPYGDGNRPPPGSVLAESPGAEPAPSSASTAWPADVDTRPGATTAQDANPEPTSDATTGNAWPQPPMNGWLDAEADAANGEASWPAAEMPEPASVAPAPPVAPAADPNFILANASDANEPPAEKPTPLPQDQPTGSKNPATPAGLPGNPPGQPTEPTIAQAMEEFRTTAANQVEELIGVIATYGKRIYEDSILKAKDDLIRIAERLRTEPAETVFSILNSFPQTRIEGNLVGGLAGILTIIANGRRGLEFERAAIDALSAASKTTKINKNTTKIAVDGLGRSIPDVLHEGVTEIKSGLEINHTVQLQIQIAHAKNLKQPFSLIVSPTTERISRPIQGAVRATGGTIQRFDPVTRAFTPFE